MNDLAHPCLSRTARSVHGAVPLLVVLVLFAGCGGPAADVNKTVDDYIVALAQRDLERLLDLYAPLGERLRSEPAAGRDAIRDQFRDHLQARYADYEAAKDTGHLEFQPDGVVLARSLNLGRGAYYETVEVEFPAADRAILVSEVRLGYRSIDMATLPVGTTIYLMGAPVGTIYNPVIGARQPAARRLLEKIWLRWSLVQGDDGWFVVSVEPDPGRPPETYADTTRF